MDNPYDEAETALRAWMKTADNDLVVYADEPIETWPDSVKSEVAGFVEGFAAGLESGNKVLQELFDTVEKLKI